MGTKKASWRLSWMRLKTGMNKIIDDISKNKTMNNESKRFYAYRQENTEVYGVMGQYNRKRVGQCFQNAAKDAFPSPKCIGFRNVDLFHSTHEDESTDNDSSVTDL